MPPEGMTDDGSSCEALATQPFTICTSALPYSKRPLDDINQGLNLNLGQTIVSPNNKTLLWIIRFLDRLLVRWWEPYFQMFWKNIPLPIRKGFTFAAWNVYFPLHRRILGRKTGIHPDASLEYHAMTTIAWWGRMIPVTVDRMRFSLSQLSVWSKHPVLSRIEWIQEEIPLESIPADQHGRVKGLWVHVAEEPTEYTLMWIYGGAFLAGDMEGNLGPAERVGRETGMDVFVVEHRLVPEVQMKDMLWDVALGYHWLTSTRNTKVLVLGISSGAGLATRLCQSVAETLHGRSTLPDYLSSVLQGAPLPAGAVLLGPFADYTTPRGNGSLMTNATHDLIVNPRVLESGLPYLETHMGGSRRDHSPIYRSFAGCPPLCVVTSEHEAVYDHAIDLVNAARSYGVPVTLGVWKYMCHVFTFLSSFVPEGEQSMQFFMDWLKEQQQQPK